MLGSYGIPNIEILNICGFPLREIVVITIHYGWKPFSSEHTFDKSYRIIELIILIVNWTQAQPDTLEVSILQLLINISIYLVLNLMATASFTSVYAALITTTVVAIIVSLFYYYNYVSQYAW